MKLALGTAQFGMPYGIANKNGQVSLEEVRRILAFAIDAGIDTLDTAIAYGQSESCLGAIGCQNFRVITKLPALPRDISNLNDWVNNQISESLSKLNLDSVYGLLIHRSSDILNASGTVIVDILQKLKLAGIVQKIGVSIYHPDELQAVLEKCSLDIVQAPFNVFDRRLVTSGWLERLHDLNIEVHVRSVFLQGLLLMPRGKVPEKFKQWSDIFDSWHAWLRENGADAITACLDFVASYPMIDRVIVGVESLSQLQSLVGALEKLPLSSLPNISCADEKLINPSTWNIQ